MSEIVVRDGKILTIDEQKLHKELVGTISGPADAKEKEELLNRLRPYILDHYEEKIPIPEVFSSFYAVNRRDSPIN